MSIPLNVQVDADAVNKMVSEAILDSAIGEQLKMQIAKQVEALGRSWGNPIERVVENEVRIHMVNLIRDEFGDVLRAKVRERLTDEALTAITSKLFEGMKWG